MRPFIDYFMARKQHGNLICIIKVKHFCGIQLFFLFSLTSSLHQYLNNSLLVDYQNTPTSPVRAHQSLIESKKDNTIYSNLLFFTAAITIPVLVVISFKHFYDFHIYPANTVKILLVLQNKHQSVVKIRTRLLKILTEISYVHIWHRFMAAGSSS